MTQSTAPDQLRAFAHEALFYDGIDNFVEQVSTVVRDGFARGDVVVVVTDVEKCRSLQAALRELARDVVFMDMAVVGANPSRIIPVWRCAREGDRRWSQRDRGR